MARIIAWLSLLLGGVMLVGWVTGSDRLAGAGLGLKPMHAYSCIGFLIAGGLLWLAQRDRCRNNTLYLAGALSLLILAGLNLAEATGLLELGLAHWTLPLSGGKVPARMPVITALVFLVLALRVLVFCRIDRPRLGDGLSVLLVGASMLAIAALGIEAVDGNENVFSPATPTAATLLLLNSLAWIAIRPTTPLGRIVVAQGPGGVIARYLLLPSLLLPLLYGWLIQWARTSLGLDESTLISLSGVAIGGSVALLVWYVAVFVERGEQQQVQLRRLRSEADTDGLTGLANRRSFDTTLDLLLRRRHAGDASFGLLMLDLDRFKSYNDSFGHHAGDDVLRQVGVILRQGLRPGDLAARYGGEEFAILLANCDLAAAIQAAERIRQAFLVHAWPHRRVTISIGVAEVLSQDSAESLVKRADTALYAAKQQGRNRVLAGPPG